MRTAVSGLYQLNWLKVGKRLYICVSFFESRIRCFDFPSSCTSVSNEFSFKTILKKSLHLYATTTMSVYYSKKNYPHTFQIFQGMFYLKIKARVFLNQQRESSEKLCTVFHLKVVSVLHYLSFLRCVVSFNFWQKDAPSQVLD